ncbi:winged helix DNA-binding domain-containing protein [Dermacoccaceae bacterium W4C1]
MTSRPRITDVQRRRRIAQRHGIAPGRRLGDPVAATRAMTVLHATEPPTVHLAVAARVDGLTPEAVDHQLYQERSLVKQLAMRRTLFVFTPDLLPAALAAPAPRVQAQEATRIIKALIAAGLASDADAARAWLDSACTAVLDVLASEPAGMSTAQVRASVPVADVRVNNAPGTAWGGQQAMAPWLLTHLGLRGQIVRGDPVGHWRNPRHRWVAAQHWFGEVPQPLPDAGSGYRELIGRYLQTFGPATETDIQWWLGSTKGAVRTALAELAAVEVDLDGGDVGYLLPDDLDLVGEDGGDDEPWAALLPVLDPTLMGWKQRDFYLDPGHVPYLFDSNGNGGTTCWWDGRVVGCWVQDPDGAVRTVLRDTIPKAGQKALQAEADRLSDFLAGDVVSSVYSSAQMKGARLP